MKTQESLIVYAKEHGVPIIRGKSGQFLQQQIRESKPQNILEIGTAIGYSGCLMLEAYEKAHLTTIEIDQNSFNKASETFAEEGFENRVTQILGDAKEILSNLVQEGQKFDFIFLDGPKGQYVKYLPLCKSLLEKGGIIFADNVYLHGLVLSKEKIAHKHRTMVTNMRKFLATVQEDDDFEVAVHAIEDGIAVIKLKSNNIQQKN